LNFININIQGVIAKNTSVAQDSEAICQLRSQSPFNNNTIVSYQ
jgi:hypothetical protein